MPCSLPIRSEEHTSELQSHSHLVCRVLFRSDRKSTRLNSSHTLISYAVFCLKKKNTNGGAVLPSISPREASSAQRLEVATEAKASLAEEVVFFNDPGTTEIYPFPPPAAFLI